MNVYDFDEAYQKLEYQGLLNSVQDIGYSKQIIAQLAESLIGLEEAERKQLQEVLLKHSIKVNLDS